MKHDKLSYKKFSYKNLPIIIIGQANNGKMTFMARLLYETGSLPAETMGEIKRISKELGKDTELAFIIDQIKKEQEKNKALGISQIFFSSGKRAYSIFNTRGCMEFVQGMITGVIHARVIVLMTDVSEPVRKQAASYVNLFKLLSIENLIVLCNKMDLINYDQKKFQDLKQELTGLLSHLSHQPPVYIPISGKQGICITKKSRQLSWYKGLHFLKALDSIQPADEEETKPFRFPVQDVYTIDGKSVIAGRIASGSVQRGDKTAIYPTKKEAHIAGIIIFPDANAKKARALENIGLVLDRAVPVNRGDVIVHCNTGVNPVSTLKVHIFWSAESPLKTGNQITLLNATQKVTCIVETIESKINTSTLEIIENNKDIMGLNEAGIVTLSTEHPVIVEKVSYIEELGRIILKKDNMIMAAGFI